MNFLFDESGGMCSKAHSEKNSNLVCFLAKINTTIVILHNLFELKHLKTQK